MTRNNFKGTSIVPQDTSVLQGASQKAALALQVVRRLYQADLIDARFAEVVKVLQMQHVFGGWGANSNQALWNICCAHVSLLTDSELYQLQDVASLDLGDDNPSIAAGGAS